MIKSVKDKVYILSKVYGAKLGLDLTYFVKNGFWMTLRQFIDMLGGLIIAVVLARIISREIFGQFQFILSVFATLSFFSLPGLNVSILRSVSIGYDGDYKDVVKKSFLWSLLAIPALVISGIYVYIFKNNDLGLAIMISSVFFPFFYAPNTWTVFFQGKSMHSLMAQYSIVQSVINVLITIAAVLINRESIIFLLSSYLLSYSFFNLLYYVKSLKYISNNSKEAGMFSYGYFLTKVGVFELISDNIDKLIIGLFLSPSLLAAYSVVSMIPLKSQSFLKSILTIVFPKMASANFNILDTIKAKKRALYLIGTAISIIGILYYFLIVKISYFLFGPKYIDYYNYSRYFVVYIIAYIPLVFLIWHAKAKRENGIIFHASYLNMFLKVILMLVFLKYFGFLGAVIAFNLSVLLMLFVYVFLTIKNLSKN